jgi:hypothetical protein
MQKLRIGSEGDVLGLHGGIDRDPRQILRPQRPVPHVDDLVQPRAEQITRSCRLSCFFGRIAPSAAATESCFSIRGNRENEIASFQGLRHGKPCNLKSPTPSLSGLEVLHGRLKRGKQDKPFCPTVTGPLTRDLNA